MRELILRIPQPIRFITAGGTVAVIYLCGTLILNTLGVTIQVAIPVAYTLSLIAQFSLQRFYVFANHDEFALELHHQIGRYLIAALLSYGTTAGLTAVLPGLLGISERIVYVFVAVGVAAITYVGTRTVVFNGAGSGTAPPAIPPHDHHPDGAAT